MEFRVFHSFLKRVVKERGGVTLVIGGAIILFFLILSLFAPFIAPYDPIKPVGPVFSPPTREFIMGTDNMGRDLFSRVVWGARTTLTVAFLATFFSSFMGITLGVVSGYRGGLFDKILTFIMDSLCSFPSFILAIAIAAVLESSLLNISLSIAIVQVPIYFRAIRDHVSSVRKMLYVEAAKALGANDWVILTKYILRGIPPLFLIIVSANVAGAVLTEVGLGFLGVGVSPLMPDWGIDLSSGQKFILQNRWWMILYPGFMVVLLILGLNLFARGLEERLSPKLKER